MPKDRNIRKYLLILLIVAIVTVCILALLGPAIENIFQRLRVTQFMDMKAQAESLSLTLRSRETPQSALLPSVLDRAFRGEL
jgi:formate hydrogenlyase subunit 4